MLVDDCAILCESRLHDKFTIAYFANLTGFYRDFISRGMFVYLKLSFFVKAVLTGFVSAKITKIKTFSFFA